MILFLIAVDENGIPIDAIRRRFSMGAIIDLPGTRSRRGSKGEDGVMGGIPFGTNFRTGA